MKKLFSTFALLLFIASFAQTSYDESLLDIPNPERGFYKHTETHSTGYTPLNVNILTSYRVNEQTTQILRVFYLENFLNIPISTTYLTKMQADFNSCRTAGVKMIVRFAYSGDDDSPSGTLNASKSWILSHIIQLESILYNNRDVITVFQAGFIGAWGEWYDTDYFGVSNLTAQNLADRAEVLNSIVTHIGIPCQRQIAVRTPKIKTNVYGMTPLTLAQAYGTLSKAYVSHHNDCFCASPDDWGTYTNVVVDYPYLESETTYLAMGGETCNPNVEFANCDNVLEKLNKFNWSYLNADYHPDVISALSTELYNNSVGCWNDIKIKLGYRFVMLQCDVENSQIKLTIKNVGTGHLYNARNAYLVYRNVDTQAEVSYQLDTDCRMWLKGNSILITQMLPTLPVGTYDVFLYLPDPLSNNPAYAIQMANQATWEGVKGYNNLNVQIHAIALGINAVVLNGVININSTDYTVTVYDMSGKQVSNSENIKELSNGVYILKIKTADNLYTKKIIKQ
jgi:uncharacterized protein DUF4832/uncharacterized protein DUF4874/type IX secretion system substrate protein